MENQPLNIPEGFKLVEVLEGNKDNLFVQKVLIKKATIDELFAIQDLNPKIKIELFDGIITVSDDSFYSGKL